MMMREGATISAAREFPDSMAQDKTPLVWVDMEMSGLVPERERILEVAMVVTDSELNTIAEAPVYVIHQPDEVLDAMDSWNKSTHGKSGLVDKVRASTFTEAEVEARLVEFLKPLVGERMAPLVRQHRAPGPPLHGALHARVRRVPALPHRRRLHAEGARQALATRTCSRASPRRASTRRSPTCTSRSRSCKHYRRTFLVRPAAA